MTTPRLEGVLTLREEASAKLRGFRNALDQTQSKLRSMRGPLLAVTGAMTGLAAITVKSASDLEESINAVNVVFGDSADRILDFGQNSARAVGLSTAAFNQMATQTGALLRDTGLSMDRVADQTNQLTVRAADLASVFNTDVQDAMSAINQAIRGETEAIRRYTGDVTDATLEQYLLSQGIDTAVQELSQQEKRLLRVRVLMEQTAFAAGDFANTSDSLANQLRIQKAQLASVSAEVGTKLIPIVTHAVGILGNMIGAMSRMSDGTQNLIIAVGGATGGLAALGLALPPIITGVRLLTAGVAALSTSMAGPAGLIALLGLAAIAVGVWARRSQEAHLATQALGQSVDSFQSSLANLTLAELELEAADLQTRMSELSIAMGKTHARIEEIRATGNGTASELGNLGITLRDQQEKWNVLTESLNMVQDKMTEVQTQTIENTGSTDQLTESIQNLDAATRDYFGPSQELISDLKEQRMELEALASVTRIGAEILAAYESGQITLDHAINVLRGDLSRQRDAVNDLTDSYRVAKEEAFDLKAAQDDLSHLPRGARRLIETMREFPSGANVGAPLPNFQTSPGQMRIIPGSSHQPVPIIAHGGEMIGRGGGGVNIHLTVYGDVNAEGLEDRLVQAIRDRIRSGGYDAIFSDI